MSAPPASGPTSVTPVHAGILATAGFLIGVQAIAGLAAWWSSWSPPLCAGIGVATLIWLWFAARARFLCGRMRWPSRLLCVSLVQLPALVSSTGLLLIYLDVPWRSLSAGGDLCGFLLPLWLESLAGLTALMPAFDINDRGFYLWVEAVLPFAIVVAQTCVRAPEKTASDPGVA